MIVVENNLSSKGTVSKRGRILYVIGSLNIGGAERHVADVSSALKLRGWQPTIFTLSLKGPLIEPLVKAGVPVKGLKLPVWVTRTLGSRLAGWLSSLLCVVMIAIELRRYPGTVAHFFLPSAYILGGIAACLVKAHPRIMSRRSLNHYHKDHPLYYKIEKFLHRRMDVLIGNSQKVVSQLRVETRDQCPVRLVFNGVQCSNARPGDKQQKRRELGLNQESFVIAIVANLIPYKGHEDLLRALGLIKKQLPIGWRLICIGRDDGIGVLLKKMAQVLGIADNIIWLGLRLDVQDCLTAIDVAISASHQEGFSNAVLEAMSEGLPLVVTNVGGNTEAVVDNYSGLVVASHDPLALGNAILKLAFDPNRAEIGARGRARSIELFSFQACIDAYELIYFDEIVKNSDCK
jgi:glycosyltransferase involved in cell wall biosynthesis